MHSNISKWALTAAVAVVMMIGAPALPAQENGSRKIEGTWDVTVTVLSDCIARTPRFSFSAILSFARGGTISGTTSNPGFVPGQRSADFGVWSHHGSNRYSANTRALVLFANAAVPPAPGFKQGSQVIQQDIELVDQNNFRSDATTQLYDANGEKYLEVCAAATAVRFE